MTLNCKPGDLARVINTESTRFFGIVDKIIKVTEPVVVDGHPVWHYDGPRLVCACGCRRPVLIVGDVLLRPIRGTDGEDEILRIAGLPTPINEPVIA